MKIGTKIKYEPKSYKKMESTKDIQNKELPKIPSEG